MRIVAAVLGLMFLLIAAWMAGDTTLRCSRIGDGLPDCTVHTRRWLWLASHDAFHPQVRRATLSATEHRVREEDPATGRDVERVETVPTLRLSTSRGDVDAVWLSKRRTGLVAEMEAFLRDRSRRSFEARVAGPNWLVILVGLGVAGLALHWIVFGDH